PELLLFQHPYAGVQVPAGTVEDGETPAQAALREAAEETGLALSDLSTGRYLGSEDEHLPADQRVTTPGPCRGRHGDHSLCPA
ncbi:MAG: NUDIX domain-containing protein, partial [Chloroflexi bacterium]|nr:NUDIX domain-containing protein [Chloroflexota bacterium]